MATGKIDWAIGDTVGATGTDATGGTLTASHHITVGFDLTLTREKFIVGLERIRNAVLQDVTWPGAGN